MKRRLMKWLVPPFLTVAMATAGAGAGPGAVGSRASAAPPPTAAAGPPAVRARPRPKAAAPAARSVPPARPGRGLPPVAIIKTTIPTTAPPDEEAPPPGQGDPDRERIQRLQEALYSIVHGPVLGRLRVGVRVMDIGSGRLLFARHGSALMDPASNQKVLATAAALLRLGSTWRFRTQVEGPAPDGDGVVAGDILLRGSGDPSLRPAHLEEMAADLAALGVTKVTGSVLADGRRIGTDEADPVARSPLRVGRSAIEIRIRPGDREGAAAAVTVRPDSDAVMVENRAITRGTGRSRVAVNLSTGPGKVKVVITGRIPARHPGLVLRRVPPNQTFYAAVLLRSALTQSGIAVQGAAGVHVPRAREVRRTAGLPPTSDIPIPLAPSSRPTVLAVHESDPLPVLMRRINKDSDNEWAERLIETVGAEIYGGAASPEKGMRALREAISDLGLPAGAYVPTNGSGLGHGNRITPDALAQLMRALFLDPRLGPDMLQSLSVGGVDGTIRNRFRGSPAAERVRAKTGTLNGKSCLSGYVGDGSDILVFSIMVQGLRPRSLASVRHAQVNAVNAMMRYARGAVGPAPGDEVAPGVDYEVGEELIETETEETEPPPGGTASPPSGPLAGVAAPTAAPKASLDQMVNKALQHIDSQQGRKAPLSSPK